jgi:hypothetical protein
LEEGGAFSPRFILIVKNGQIVAATFAGPSNTQGIDVFVAPLRDQEVHEVDVPEELIQLPAEDQLTALVNYRLDPGKSYLERSPQPGGQSSE